MKQPCGVLAINARFPHELTTLPSASNSIIGGAAIAKFLSLGAGSPLVTANTWSRASTQTLPTDPSTHPSGKGLGQDGSYLNCGASTVARADARVTDTEMTTLTAVTATATAIIEPENLSRIDCLPFPRSVLLRRNSGETKQVDGSVFQYSPIARS